MLACSTTLSLHKSAKRLLPAKTSEIRSERRCNTEEHSPNRRHRRRLHLHRRAHPLRARNRSLARNDAAGRVSAGKIDKLNAGDLRAGLGECTIGGEIIVLGQTTSTNDAIWQRATPVTPEGLVIFGEQQT